MCIGTRCVHHIDPAVRELERPYDDWKYTRHPLYEEFQTPYYRDELEPAAYLLRVVGRHTYNPSGSDLGNGPSHDQPMIRIKNDIGRWGGVDDEQATRAMRCGTCPQHQCGDCGRSLPHMSVGKCPDCWWTNADTDLVRGLRENA